MTSRYSLSAVSFAAIVACNAHGATGNLVVFDDADQNSFDHNAALCTTGGDFFGETTVVHSGTAAVAVSTQNDNNGGGWAATVSYSATSDYDAVTLWVNAGNNSRAHTSPAIFDMSGNPHFMHLEDMYGGPLPAATWIQFVVPFGSDLFQQALSTPPDTVQSICVITHSATGSFTDFFYLDDVSLRGADIFKSAFEN